jgi:hypothetical protein
MSHPTAMGFYQLDLLITAEYMSKPTDFMSAYRRTFLEALLVYGGHIILIIILQYIVCSQMYLLFPQKFGLQSTPFNLHPNFTHHPWFQGKCLLC